ncbi:hypothetical protein GA0074692_6769 [Micromonospora pallida]|uniref:Uncharacterized protein n=1 Tax=Micromonospora pallida TaxID=145854 RepID=A0A1C6TN79_9ACTN|nr:hypothetical protein [Micromonospora pallida]SCL43216.1 hypothetical protein GA0074692_6769 [Micromonospora pallida]
MTGGKAISFQPGELVRIEIDRATVVRRGGPGHLVLAVDGVQLPALLVDLAGVRVERVAPAEWPPVPGDLWRADDEGVWFAHLYRTSGTYPRTELRMIPMHDDGGRYSFPDKLLAVQGPMRLVHREQADPTGDEATGDRS